MRERTGILSTYRLHAGPPATCERFSGDNYPCAVNEQSISMRHVICNDVTDAAAKYSYVLGRLENGRDISCPNPPLRRCMYYSRADC